VGEELVVDLNAKGAVVGRASEQLDPPYLETVALPLRTTRAA
jgi:hypothetical protein